MREADSGHHPIPRGCMLVRGGVGRVEMGQPVKIEVAATCGGCQPRQRPEFAFVEWLNVNLVLVNPHLDTRLMEEVCSHVRELESLSLEQLVKAGCRACQCSLPERIQIQYLLPQASNPGPQCRIPPFPHLQ